MSGAGDKPPVISDGDLEALLERRRMRDPRRERVIDNVLATLEREERPAREPAPTRWWSRPRRWRWPMAFGLTAAAAVALVLVLRPSPPGDAGWQVRGGGGPVPPVEVGCDGGTLAACPAGSTLIFRSDGTGGPGYLAAFVDPVTAGRERIWYFSGAQAPLGGPAGAPTVLGKGIHLGPEHAPGAYDLHLVVLRRPLAPAEVARAAPADVIAEQKLRLVVVP